MALSLGKGMSLTANGKVIAQLISKEAVVLHRWESVAG